MKEGVNTDALRGRLRRVFFLFLIGDIQFFHFFVQRIPVDPEKRRCRRLHIIGTLQGDLDQTSSPGQDFSYNWLFEFSRRMEIPVFSLFPITLRRAEDALTSSDS